MPRVRLKEGERRVKCSLDGSCGSVVTMDVQQEESLIGSVIDGRYLILSLIGKGETSVVYKARHQLMGRTVAIKFLKWDGHEEKTKLGRFQEEAKALALLSHPNVVAVHDSGVTSESQPFVVMDFVDGRSLANVLNENGPIAPARAVGIFIQICDGLSHAHSKGIVHRDLKPGNIMLISNESGREQAQIVDFGIAKLTASAGGSSQKLTQTGAGIGNASYRSPEQWAGSASDARSDVYSLGCIMYESLTGVSPFPTEKLLEVMLQNRDEKPRPVTDVKTELRISAGLEVAISRALEREPEKRYQSAEELKQDLAATPEGQESLGSAVPSGREASKRKSISKSLIENGKSLSIALALAVVLSAGFIWYASTPVGILLLTKLSVSVQEITKGPSDPQYLDSLSRLIKLLCKNGEYGEAEKQSNRLVQSVVTKYGVASPQAMAAYAQRADSYCENGRFLEAAQQYEKDVTDIVIKYGKKSKEAAYAWVRLSEIYSHIPSMQGRARNFYTLSAQVFLELAEGAFKHRRFDDAELFLSTLLSDSEKMKYQHSLGSIAASYTLVRLKKTEGHDEEATELFVRTLQNFAPNVDYGSLKPTGIYTVTSGLASQFEEQKRYGLAEKLRLAQLASSEKLFGPDAEPTGQAAFNVGHMYFNRTVYPASSAVNRPLIEKAETYYKRAMPSFEKKGNADGELYSALLYDLGTCESALGQYPEALRHFRLSFALYERVRNFKATLLFHRMIDCIQCFYKSNHIDEFLGLSRDAEQEAEKLGEQGTNHLVSVYAGLAMYHGVLDHHSEALQYCKRVASLFEKYAKVWKQRLSDEDKASLKNGGWPTVLVFRKLGLPADADKLEKEVSSASAKQ